MKLGIYGGTFSPPHNGHIHAARAFLQQINPDLLLIMPTNIPPHKENASVCAASRFEMTRLAFSHCPEYPNRIRVDDYEIQKKGKSYTADTLAHFAQNGDDLYFLCGTDMFLTLFDWYRPDLICRYATIVLMRRETDSALDGQIREIDRELKEKLGARTTEIRLAPIEVSSSLIRERLRCGQDISDLVPDRVRDYIYENKLYGTGE
ncbi:MAG: nicotinate (nicotinamide) nucleotide adenylyltransferase [Eubacteriales bacterium]